MDIASIPVFEEVCQRHLNKDRRVHLNIGSPYHIGMEGKNFLTRMRDKVILEQVPEYIRIELEL